MVKMGLARAASALLALAGWLLVSETAWACPYCASGGVSPRVAVLMMGVLTLPFLLSGVVLRVVLKTASDRDWKETSGPAGG